MGNYVTIDDYYDCNNAFGSPMVEEQRYAIEEITDTFKEFCETVGLKWSGDWDYCCPCGGIKVEIDIDGDCFIDGWEPVSLGKPDVVFGSCWRDFHLPEFINKYNEHYTRLAAVYKWLDRKQWHFSRAITYDWLKDGKDDYKHRKDRMLEKRYESVVDHYQELVDKMCEDIASLYEELMYKECEYYESDEAAIEWVSGQDGIPITRDMVRNAVREFGIGWDISDEQYDRVCEILHRYMRKTRKYNIGEQEIRLAVRLIAA